jgi:hypothetical protein
MAIHVAAGRQVADAGDVSALFQHITA